MHELLRLPSLAVTPATAQKCFEAACRRRSSPLSTLKALLEISDERQVDVHFDEDSALRIAFA